MTNPIPIAVVGLGRAGWNLHVRQIQEKSVFKIVDIAEPDHLRRAEAERKLGCKTHADIDSLLAGSSAQIVVVATPNTLHESDSVKVLKSGRHCILEKPMANSSASAERIIEASKKSDRLLFVHHQRRFSDEFRFLREIIDSNLLGPIFHLRLFWGVYARRNDWQTLRKNRGGLLNNHGPHALDIALNLLDAPVKDLFADLQHVKDAGDCEDHFSLFLKAANGQTAEITCTSVCALPPPRTLIMGANGTLSAENAETAKLRWFDPKQISPLEVTEGPAPDRRYGIDEKIPWQEKTVEMKPEKPEVDFYDNVFEVLKRNAKMIVTPESAAESIRIIERAHETSTTRVATANSNNHSNRKSRLN